MELALILMLIIISIQLWVVVYILNKNRTNDGLKLILDKIEEVKPRGAVTDPFKAANKPAAISTSSKHIVIRKSPDQIRNENYEEIRQGNTYGHI